MIEYALGFLGGVFCSERAYRATSSLPTEWTLDPTLPRGVEPLFHRARDVGSIGALWMGPEFLYTFTRKDHLHFALDVIEGGCRGALIGAAIGAYQGKTFEVLAGMAAGSVAGSAGALLGHFCRRVKNLL